MVICCSSPKGKMTKKIIKSTTFGYWVFVKFVFFYVFCFGVFSCCVWDNVRLVGFLSIASITLDVLFFCRFLGLGEFWACLVVMIMYL